MKLFIKILFFSLLILNINKAFVEDINNYSNKTNTEKIVLIEKYLIDHKIKINNLVEKYKLEENIQINKNIERINYLIKSIEKVQNNDLGKEKEKLIINSILKEIKKINEELKVIVKIKVDEFNKKINDKVSIYSNLGIRIAKKLDEIDKKLKGDILIEKKILTLRESKIKNSLYILRLNSKKLKKFSKIKFNSEEEIKTSFIRILKEIRFEIFELKKILE